MKYKFDGIALSELIKNYKISDNKIIIKFFDDSCREISLTEENEKEILNEMYIQALKRNESSALKKAKRERTHSFIWMLSSLYFAVSKTIQNYKLNSEDVKFMYGFFAGCFTIFLIVHGTVYVLKNGEVRELEKYEIYLCLKEQIENIKDNSIYNGINNKKLPLNINTIDKFSLKDLRKIRDNILNRGLESSNNLTKKISK